MIEMHRFRICSALVVAGMLAGPVFATTAEAQSRRPDVRKMTCEQVKELVKKTGAVVLTTGQYTYDRYVSNQFYCPSGMETKNAWVATSDTQKCLIGYTCEIRIPWPSGR